MCYRSAVVCHENKSWKETVRFLKRMKKAGAFAPAFFDVLAFEILRLIKNFEIKSMIYFTYQNALENIKEEA